MNGEEWVEKVNRRLRAAAAAPPTAQEILPEVQSAATRAAALSAARGRSVRLSVSATATQVRVEASGRGAGPALATARAEIDRQRPQMAAKLRTEAARRLHR